MSLNKEEDKRSVVLENLKISGKDLNEDLGSKVSPYQNGTKGREHVEYSLPGNAFLPIMSLARTDSQ